MRGTAQATAPMGFWAIVALSLLWNSFCVYDYVHVNIRDHGYIARFSPELIQALDALPSWLTIIWGSGVCAALAGSVLLLLRSRLAIFAFLVALAGQTGNAAYQLGVELPRAARTSGMTVMSLIACILIALLLFYSIRLRREGFLR